MQDAPGHFLYGAYKGLTNISASALSLLLERRLKRGKEISERVEEKKGLSKIMRPAGPLAWVHAASVGEVQSALILIHKLVAVYPGLNVLVTTGTVTSSRIVEGKLPEGAIHQFYPLDHPSWVDTFFERWKPDLVFWMESELWPNMLEHIRIQQVPAVLVNARMSPRSLQAWSWAKPLVARMLGAFSLILAQTEDDAARLKSLGYSGQIVVTDNLKYSAEPLGYDPAALQELNKATEGRPLWVYASTHKGEEDLASRVHKALKVKFPKLLTIIVPRHPERRSEIDSTLQNSGLTIRFRGDQSILPEAGDDLYIADTLGELGLFYRLAPVACIGRSFSDDGGGGHNPLEAAQIGCAVLHGPNVQNLQQIFDEMDQGGAAIRLKDETTFIQTLATFFVDTQALNDQQKAGQAFAESKTGVIDRVMNEITPILKNVFPEPEPSERSVAE